MAMEVPLDQLEAEHRAGSALPPLHHRTWTKEKAREVFITLDRDCNGLLTHNELLKGMRRMLVHDEHVKKLQEAPVTDVRTTGGQPAVTMEQFWKITAPPHSRVKQRASSTAVAAAAATDNIATSSVRSRTPPASNRSITHHAHASTGSTGKSSPLHVTRQVTNKQSNGGAGGTSIATPSTPPTVNASHKFSASDGMMARNSTQRHHNGVDAVPLSPLHPQSPLAASSLVDVLHSSVRAKGALGGHVRKTSHSTRILHDDISRTDVVPPPPPDITGILPGSTTGAVASNRSRQSTKVSSAGELGLLVANEPSPGKTHALGGSALPSTRPGDGRSHSLSIPVHVLAHICHCSILL
jgi:hypothetical protein